MPALPELQAAFAEAMLGDALAQRRLATLCQPDRIDPALGIAAYRRCIHGRWLQALQASYPVLEQVTGTAFFAAATRAYIAACPSVQGDLNGYGHRLGEFLHTWEPASALPYLGDLARLEWAVQTALEAADEEPPASAWSVLAADDFDGLRLRWHPALARIDSRWPVGAIWRAHHPLDAAALAAIDDQASAQELVYRSGDRVVVQAISAGTAAWLDALGQGETLGDAVQAALLREPGFDLSAALLQSVQQGLLIPQEGTTP